MSDKIHYTIAERPLTADEIAAEFFRLGRRDAFARALTQILQERLAAATVEASAPRATEREAGHTAGRLAELIGLQNEFAALLSSPAR